MFRNRDANYLLSCADHSEPDEELWARVSGILPQTPTSLYEEPYVGNMKDYDVRYISISSVNRSPPSIVYQTVKDEEIVEHYDPKVRRDDDKQWDYPPFRREDDDDDDDGGNRTR